MSRHVNLDSDSDEFGSRVVESTAQTNFADGIGEAMHNEDGVAIASLAEAGYLPPPSNHVERDVDIMSECPEIDTTRNYLEDENTAQATHGRVCLRRVLILYLLLIGMAAYLNIDNNIRVVLRSGRGLERNWEFSSWVQGSSPAGCGAEPRTTKIYTHTHFSGLLCTILTASFQVCGELRLVSVHQL